MHAFHSDIVIELFYVKIMHAINLMINIKALRYFFKVDYTSSLSISNVIFGHDKIEIEMYWKQIKTKRSFWTAFTVGFGVL